MKKTGLPMQSSQDLKQSLRLLFRNYKPFLKMQLFAILLTLIVFFIIIGIGFVYRSIFGTEIVEPLKYVGGAFIASFSGFITIFLSTANGLAVDLIDSGDQFTEFRNSFRYFVKYWWQYGLIALIVFGFPNTVQGIITNPPIQVVLRDMSWEMVLLFEAIGLIISYIWYGLFMSLYPSITAQGNLKHAFIENFRILRSNSRRVFGTWALFFLVFHVPTYVFASLALIFHIPPFGIFWMIFMLLNLFVGIPLQYLMAAGMYFNIHFERFKPLD